MNFFKKLFYTPLQTTLSITSPSGFHLRPVAIFVSQAKLYNCEIILVFQGKSISAKAINAVLSLALAQGDSFELIGQGKDAPQALEALEACFIQLMKQENYSKAKKETIKAQAYEGQVLEAQSLAQGIAIAPLYIYKEEKHLSSSPHSFDQALALSLEELSQFSPNNEGIYLAQKELLIALAQDSTGFKAFEHKIKEASKALKNTSLEAKQSDYQDILQRVQKHLGVEISISYPQKPFILLADDLLPSQIEELQKTAVKAVILKNTSPLSHTAILLRAWGIPSVIARLDKAMEESLLIVDAFAQVLVADPSQKDLDLAQKSLDLALKNRDVAHEKRFEKAYNKKQKHIHVLANISDVSSAKQAKEAGADGIGLLRSEFLFKSVKPSLENQIQAYESIFALFDTLTIRTLDVGGDKALPYISIPVESNPFLGIRGVRLFRTHPQILEEQLLAIFKASQGKAIKVMFPMVSTLEEFNKAKAFAVNIAKKHQLDIANIAFGIMIEVPSVLFLLLEFNKVVDFYSIGTNDLSQYLFATERTHPLLKIDTLSPVIFSAIEMITSQVNKPLSICGELASDPKALAKLLDLGITTLSVSLSHISQTKEEIRHV